MALLSINRLNGLEMQFGIKFLSNDLRMVTLKMTPAQSIWKDHIQDLFRRVGRSLLGGTIGMSRKAGLEKQMEIFTNWSRPAAMEETSKES